MSDPLKSSGFPRYLKLALMGLAGVIIAGLGAVATLSLRNPKISVHEENHAVAQENTQAAHATEIPALSVQDSQEHRDADDSKADPFSPEALGFTESEPRLDNDGQDVQQVLMLTHPQPGLTNH